MVRVGETMGLVRHRAKEGERWRNGGSAPLASFAFGLLALAGGGASAAPSHCEEVPPAERGLCRMVLSCSVIEDAERREQCFRAAAVAAEDDAPPAASDEPAMSPSVPAEEATPPAEAPPREQVAQPPPVAANVVAREVVERTVLDIPDRFVAKVSAVRALVRNRQLLVLDGDLLFETDRAAQSRIDVGDEVSVVRASSLFGRRYRITAPARAAVSATRLRCERLDLGTDTRRKCALIERDGGRPD